MIYCPDCGAEIPEKGDFCPECGTLIEDVYKTKSYHEDLKVPEFSDFPECIEKWDLSPAAFMALIFKPKYLDKYFKSAYRITLLHFILKDFLKLEIKSSKLVLYKIHHLSVKRGSRFDELVSMPLKSYEVPIKDAFLHKNSFKIDPYEKGPFSYKFESKTFNDLFVNELVALGYFEFKKRSLMGLGAREYSLTETGGYAREEILNQLGYDLPDKISKYRSPDDYLYILSFFGVNTTITRYREEIKIFHQKLLQIEKVYEGRRTGTQI